VLVAGSRAFRLLHGGTLQHRPDVAVELLLLRVCRLGQIAQEHRCVSDVLPSLCKLRLATDVRDDGLLDLTGARPHAARNITSIRLRVASGVHRCGRRLVLPSLT
jgi:hypothetical protein